MRENRTYGSDGGGARVTGLPNPYLPSCAGQADPELVAMRSGRGGQRNLPVAVGLWTQDNRLEVVGQADTGRRQFSPRVEGHHERDWNIFAAILGCCR